MKSLPLISVAVTIILTSFIGCDNENAIGPTGPLTWIEMESPTETGLYAVWGSRGNDVFAVGYAGGGLLLLINIVMIFFIPSTWGERLSFLSVAIWWGVFSIPLFLRVPEPPSATVKLAAGETVFGVSFRRLWDTLKDVRRYRELLKFLIAFLIYADGIGTIIGVAAIYGAELGFDTISLVLALLLPGGASTLLIGAFPCR